MIRTYQEILLATNPVVVCGDQHATWVNFERNVIFLETAVEGIPLSTMRVDQERQEQGDGSKTDCVKPQRCIRIGTVCRICEKDCDVSISIVGPTLHHLVSFSWAHDTLLEAGDYW
jgi:hypothetical protein